MNDSSAARLRPPLGLTLPISVIGVKDASQLIISVPGNVVLTAIVLGIRVPEMREPTEFGFRLLPEGRAAADAAASCCASIAAHSAHTFLSRHLIADGFARSKLRQSSARLYF